MNVTNKPLLALTVADLMNRDVVVIPLATNMRAVISSTRPLR